MLWKRKHGSLRVPESIAEVAAMSAHEYSTNGQSVLGRVRGGIKNFKENEVPIGTLRFSFP